MSLNSVVIFPAAQEDRFCLRAQQLGEELDDCDIMQIRLGSHTNTKAAINRMGT